jgi:hypothetical protein
MDAGGGLFTRTRPTYCDEPRWRGSDMSKRAVAALAGVLTVTMLLIAGVALARSDVARAPFREVRSVMTVCHGSNIGVFVEGEPRLLTHDDRSFGGVLSPDGRMVAFYRGDPAQADTTQGWGRGQIWVMTANGENARPLTEMTSMDNIGDFVWSPDSRSLMYVVKGGLNRVDVATAATSVLVDGVEPGTWVHWLWLSYAPSPDGTQIATAGDLSIITLADGTQQFIAEGEFGWTDGVTWSPDGEWLVMTARSLVTSDREGGLWAYRLEDGATWRISENRNVQYEWTGPDELLNIRDGEGDSQTAYLSDLSDRTSTPIDVPEQRIFPGDLLSCPR